jgi:hypothetical protein
MIQIKAATKFVCKISAGDQENKRSDELQVLEERVS